MIRDWKKKALGRNCFREKNLWSGCSLQAKIRIIVMQIIRKRKENMLDITLTIILEEEHFAKYLIHKTLQVQFFYIYVDKHFLCTHMLTCNFKYRFLLTCNICVQIHADMQYFCADTCWQTIFLADTCWHAIFCSDTSWHAMFCADACWHAIFVQIHSDIQFLCRYMLTWNFLCRYMLTCNLSCADTCMLTCIFLCIYMLTCIFSADTWWHAFYVQIHADIHIFVQIHADRQFFFRYMLTCISLCRYMLTQPDRFDVALLHLDRPVFYQAHILHTTFLPKYHPNILKFEFFRKIPVLPRR